MRVLITDFLAESDFEREVLPGVEVDALLSLIGHPPTPTDLVRVLGERPAEVLITWYEMFFDPCTGYLDHPFKNKHVQTEKDRHSLLANTGGSV